MVARLVRDAVFYNPKAAPHVPSPVPFFGNIVAFGERSVDARPFSWHLPRAADSVRLVLSRPTHPRTQARAFWA